MLSVVDTLNSIEQAGYGLRDDEDKMTRIVEAASDELASLQTEQSTLFRSLAKVRLDSLQQEQAVGGLDMAERKAMAAAEAQKEQLAALAKQLDQLGGDLQSARDERAAREARVAEMVSSIRDLEAQTESRMAQDVVWQAQDAKAAGAEARMLAAEEKALQSEQDCEEKSKPYLADKLFVYLWQRGYGTSKYAAGGLVRMGDDYVARVVQYEPARQNYFTLTEIPKRLREHADRLKIELEEEEAKLAALERNALEADGIGSKESALTEAEQALKAAEDRILALEDELKARSEERAVLLSDHPDSALSKALSDLAQSLQSQELRTLLHDALDTPTTEDDQIVMRLQTIEKAIVKKQQEVDKARQTAMDIARKRAELERSANDFRREGYNRMGGGFANDQLIGDVIGGILKGALSSRELRDALRSGYRQGPGAGRRSRRGGFNDTLGGTMGGHWGGTFGGSRGGGFKTGGGF
ncbi:hypothetical protein [Cohaesibacter intestini]|uniref:hypothetical protein n=1 Tax=Cohaesibacter intestini TaxID=2211145 RepID=UPI000DE8D39C|nr:hypothetical protein [Cohaesibacter intestini]